MIREISSDEFGGLWPLFREVVAAGDTFVYSEDITEAEARAAWATPPSRCFVFEQNGEIVGGYMLRPNQPGRGSHVANAGYLVSSKWRGMGFASQMCEHSLDTARAAGFAAMQFNIVVSSNLAAVRAWEKHGFQTVGRVPKAFRHASLGFVDTLIMHRFL